MAGGADPFDAARLDDDPPRPSLTPAWQSSLRHELGRLRAARRRTIARTDATKRVVPPPDGGRSESWQRYADLQIGAAKADAVVASIGDNLAQAQALLDASARASWVTRLFRAGAVYEAVLAALQRAREGFLLVEEDSWVSAQLPTLRAGVVTAIPADDPRRDAYARYLEDLTRALSVPAPGTAAGPVPPGAGLGGATAQPVGAGGSAASPSAPSGGFSGGFSGLPAVPTVGSGMLPVQPWTADSVVTPTFEQGAGQTALPLWVQRVSGAAPVAPASRLDDTTREVLRSIQGAVSDARLAAQIAVRVYRNALVAATVVLFVIALAFPLAAQALHVELAAGPDAGALPQGKLGTYLAAVELWGVLGSVVAVIAGLWRLRFSRQPSGLQVAQLALKLPAGALTAMFGVLLLQGGIVVQLTAVQDAQVPAYAILFGFAQEALTRFVDGKANSLLEDAKPLSDKAG